MAQSLTAVDKIISAAQDLLNLIEDGDLIEKDNFFSCSTASLENRTS